MSKGELVEFTNLTTGETFLAIISRLVLYDSVRTLLESEGTEFTLSSTNDLEQGIKSIESINNYKEYIDKFGVFALEINILRSKSKTK